MGTWLGWAIIGVALLGVIIWANTPPLTKCIDVGDSRQSYNIPAATELRGSGSEREYRLACEYYKSCKSKYYSNRDKLVSVDQGEGRYLDPKNFKDYCIIQARIQVASEGYIPSNVVYNVNVRDYNPADNGYYTYETKDVRAIPKEHILIWLKIYDTTEVEAEWV